MQTVDATRVINRLDVVIWYNLHGTLRLELGSKAAVYRDSRRFPAGVGSHAVCIYLTLLMRQRDQSADQVDHKYL